jgi:hypothetical protein
VKGKAAQQPRPHPRPPPNIREDDSHHPDDPNTQIKHYAALGHYNHIEGAVKVNPDHRIWPSG